MVAAAEVAVPYLLGTRVAATVSRNILDPAILQGGEETVLLLTCGILGALVWNILAWYLKLPTSSSLTLVGGLIGPALYRYGLSVVPWHIFLLKVVLVMFLSPLAGLAAGYLICLLARIILAGASCRANRSIRHAHLATLVFLGMNHGTNDSQKAMGIIALLLFAAGLNPEMDIPFWGEDRQHPGSGRRGDDGGEEDHQNGGLRNLQGTPSALPGVSDRSRDSASGLQSGRGAGQHHSDHQFQRNGGGGGNPGERGALEYRADHLLELAADDTPGRLDKSGNIFGLTNDYITTMRR
ncbi:MAG: inorganic phosphate transporter [Candidatus Erginobacter occultus]|nr:inorganic phosphate transporter [Candidatus Erginobacter occultus]